MAKDPDLFEGTVAGCLLVVAVLMVLAILAACVIAPLNGIWVPDIALGFWAAVALVLWLIYRVRLWLK